jgi:tetratricopeptide (TPR) repeat protein
MRFRQYSPILALFAWCALIGIVFAASDCGCGGLPDSGPPSGWSDAGNSAMSSYSGFGGSSGGTTAGSSSSDPGSTAGNSQGSTSTDGTNTGAADPGSSGSTASGSSAGGYSDQALKLTSQGIALFRQGDFNKSLDALNQSLSRDPYSEKTWIITGDVLSAMDRLNESLEAYTQGLHLDKADPGLYAKIGNVQIRMGAYQAAVSSYDRALALQPDFPEAVVNRTKAAGLASGIVAMAATPGPSAAPTIAAIHQPSIPVETGTGPASPPVAPTQASLPALVAIPAFGMVLVFFRDKKKQGP